MHGALQSLRANLDGPTAQCHEVFKSRSKSKDVILKGGGLVISLHEVKEGFK